MIFPMSFTLGLAETGSFKVSSSTYLNSLLLHTGLEALPEPAEPALVPLVLVHSTVAVKSEDRKYCFTILKT
jgi:hypothetical protein